jgi:hypothetical protein
VLPIKGGQLNRSLGSPRSAIELRPLVVSDCTQEIDFRPSACGIQGQLHWGIGAARRVAPRNLFDFSAGDDNLFGADRYSGACGSP